MLKKKLLDSRWIYSYKRMHTNFFQYGLSFFLSFFLSFLLCRCFSLSLTSDQVWKLQRSCRSRNLTGYCAAPHQTLDNYAPMKVRPFANSFEVGFKSRFSSKWSLRCWTTSSSFDEWRAVFFSYGARPWKPRPRTQTSFLLEARSTFTRHWTAGRTKALIVNIAISKKKKRAQRRSWCVPGPLKRGQEHFSCPLLSGPGTLSMHHRARMVFSSPCADVADWSMP